MDWQLIIVGVIIGIAALYIGRRIFDKIRATRKGSSCVINCGCRAKSKDGLIKPVLK